MLDTHSPVSEASPPFQAPQPDIPKTPYRQNYQNLQVSAPPAVQMDKNLYVGPGTAKIIGNDPDNFYTPEQIRALHQQAGGQSLVILTPEDKKFLTHPENERQSIKEIRSWLPNSYNDLSDEELHAAYKDIVHADTNYHTLHSKRFSEKRDKWVNNGAVIVIPGSPHNEDYYRHYTGVGFRKDLMDQEILKETALATAAHEASHVKGEQSGNHRESYADAGIDEFTRVHPQWFPRLANEDGADNYSKVILGGRALSTYMSRDYDSHMKPAFCSPTTVYCMPETENSSAGVDHVRADVLKTVRDYERKNHLQTDQWGTNPDTGKQYINPAHPQFVRDVEVLRMLRDKGAFDNKSWAERNYVDNVLNGADYYLDKNALQTARAEVRKTKAPAPPSNITAQLR